MRLPRLGLLLVLSASLSLSACGGEKDDDGGSSSSSESGDGDGDCVPDGETDECRVCLWTNCCAETTACVEDEGCNCYSECTGQDMSQCDEACNYDPDNDIWNALVLCTVQNCLSACM